MAIDKVIKEFKNKDLVYQLGYNLYYNKVYPCIEIYKNNKLFSGGYWNGEGYAGSFDFYADNSSSNTDSSVGYVNTIKEMFNKLKKYNGIPQNIENEFENMFIMYKLNDFNKI